MYQFGTLLRDIVPSNLYQFRMQIEIPKGKDSDFILFLKSEFLKRKNKNDRYSLRAFAKNLSTSHVNLSLILRGQRPLTGKFIKATANKLNCGPDQIKQFTEHLLNEKGNAYRSPSEDPIYNQLSLDTWEFISNWYFDSILEYVRIPGAIVDAKTISKVFEIHTFEAERALDVLLRLKLLEKNARGVIKNESKDTTTELSFDLTSAALKNYQKQILEKSIDALMNLDRSFRDHTSSTIAFDESQLPEVKKMIAEFRQKFARFTQRSGRTPNSVYQLSIGFFPLAPQKRIKELSITDKKQRRKTI